MSVNWMRKRRRKEILWIIFSLVFENGNGSYEEKSEQSWGRHSGIPHQSRSFSVRHLHQLPVATLTNDHKPGSLKQQKFTLLQFWRPEIQIRFHQAKFQAHFFFFWRLRYNPFLASSCLQCLLHSHLVFSSSVFCLCVLFLVSLLLENVLLCLDFTWIIQNDFPTSKP